MGIKVIAECRGSNVGGREYTAIKADNEFFHKLINTHYQIALRGCSSNDAGGIRKEKSTGDGGDGYWLGHSGITSDGDRDCGDGDG